jgi:hypothetical protein
MRALMVVLVLPVVPLTSGAQTDADASHIEIVAAHSLLSQRTLGAVTLEPVIFTRQGDRLIASTMLRPPLRQQAFEAALRTAVAPAGRQPVVVRTTEPVVDGTEARVVVQLSTMSVARPTEEWETRNAPSITTVETVEVVLESRGADWIVRAHIHPRRARRLATPAG